MILRKEVVIKIMSKSKEASSTPEVLIHSRDLQAILINLRTNKLSRENQSLIRESHIFMSGRLNSLKER